MNSGNDQIEEDTDDRWGISIYVHKRDKLDQRHAQLMLRSQEISEEEDAANATFKTAFDDIQENIGIHKAAILEFQVIFYCILSCRHCMMGHDKLNAPAHSFTTIL